MWMQHWSNSVPSTLGLNWFFLEKKQHCITNHLNKLQRLVYCQMLIVVLLQFTLDRAMLVSPHLQFLYRDRQLLLYWVQHCVRRSYHTMRTKIIYLNQHLTYSLLILWALYAFSAQCLCWVLFLLWSLLNLKHTGRIHIIITLKSGFLPKLYINDLICYNVCLSDSIAIHKP